ncbi:MAG: LysR family transcriptional regulator [Rhizobiaceae bacterium]
MDLPSQMILFARVVEAESFSAAARTLGQTPSAVSRQIGYLEDRVGVRLLSRSRHGLVVTDEGRAFYERCSDISNRVRDAETFANSLDDHPKGRLKLVSTVAFGKSQLLPILPEFYSRYPDVSISLEFTDRRIDVSDGSMDLAIRFTEQIHDDTVFARKLAMNRRVICASPSYLEKFGTPKRFTDLKRHNCLQLSTVESWNEWPERSSTAKPAMSLSGNFETNSADGVYHASLAGLGVARLSTYLISDDIAAGRLVRLFPDYEDNGSDIFAVYPQKKNLSPKVRALIDYMIEIFGSNPPWERKVPDEDRIKQTG